MSSSLWSFVSREAWPLKGRAHLAGTFQLIEQIPTNPALGRWFCQINVLLLLSCIQSLVHFLVDHPLVDLATFDYLGLNQAPPIVNITKILLSVTTSIYYYYIYFFLGKSKTFPIYKRTLFGHRAFVLGSRFDFWRPLLYTQSFYQVLVAMFELWLVSAYVQFCQAVFYHPFDSIYMHVLVFLSMTVSFALFSVTCLLCCVGSAAGCAGVLLNTILFERIKMINKTFLRRRLDRFTVNRLLAYRRYNFKTMQLLFELNKSYGPLLLSFLILGTPSNCIIFVSFFFYEVPVPVHMRFAAAVIVTGEMTVIIFFHYVAALVSKRIHDPYKLINLQYVHYRTRSHLSHLRIAGNIQTFLVKKRYGITYNWKRLSFGLVSLFAFFKYFLLYSEMMMYGYSMYVRRSLKELRPTQSMVSIDKLGADLLGGQLW